MEEQEHLLKEATSDEYKENRHRFAGFWMRLWAYLLDLIVVASLNGIVVLPFVTMTGLKDIRLTVFSLEAILATFITFVYFILLTKKWGQTIGKRVLGIKVISKEYKSLSWQSVIFREIIGRYIIQAFLLTYSLYLIIPFQKQKQGLHDMVGDTYVIHEE